MGKKRATIKDVAKEAGVSVSVVSYVLNRTVGKTISAPTRQRVLEAMEKVRYVPNSVARGMRTKKTMTIGLVSYWTFDESIFTGFLRGFTAAAIEQEYSILFCASGRRPLENFGYLDYYRRNQVDAMFFVSASDVPGYEELPHIQALVKAEVPFVAINAFTAEPGVSYVYLNYEATGYLAMEYLYRLGHRHIAFCSLKLPNFHTSAERLKGAEKAAAVYGIQHTVVDRANLDGFLLAVKAGASPFTAVVTDLAATGHVLYQRAHVLGIAIPEQLSVIAANAESYTAYMIPPLTTMYFQPETIGPVAMNMLLEKIAGKKDGCQVYPDITILERASCKRIG